MPDKPDLAALIGSRICHDLISPIGAISNGVELLAMDGATKGPELSLISESVSNANARIRLFRIAFGSTGGDSRIARGEVITILADITRGSRLRIDWTSPTDLSRRDVKLAFLAIQCMESAMPWGGQISVANTDHWTVSGEAHRLRIEPALWDALTDPKAEVEITPAMVHFALLADEILRQKGSLTVDRGVTALRIAF
ncbi:MAG: histidine phosphotransferase [Cereibacter sphaeroides]|uniref:Histidine phosphotransferase n=1 Tax=Cereibacter sphaeroides TaxID=1063 RepID=A0A2W5RY88_CERSP|nr:MAG: histidine phosphotransferase [Cereibacter sphaeroides]